MEFGGPDVLRLVDLPVPEPGEGELLIRVDRAGLNFGDTHQRRNEYIAKRGLRHAGRLCLPSCVD